MDGFSLLLISLLFTFSAFYLRSRCKGDLGGASVQEGHRSRRSVGLGGASVWEEHRSGL